MKRMRLGPHWRDEGLIFTNSVGGLVEARNFLRRVHYPLLEKAGLRKFNIHALRHTAASFLMEAGVPQKVIGEILGHTRMSTTARYQHASMDAQRAAMGAIEKMLGA